MRPEDLGTYYESILDKEARKEGGVYYSPPLIVDYMIEHSLGALLQGKTPKDVAKIKIVDPACGAGIFLLGTYQFLLDWYAKHNVKLTLTKRRKILTDNIFGVDIDPLAVEITKYCLSMKCSEGADFSQDLDKNIRCGDSLVELNWKETFPKIFKQGGFDIVIGNPPYGARYPEEHKTYFKEHYQSAKTIKGKQKGSLDTFSLFIENAFNQVKLGGHVSFIVPLSAISSDAMTALHNILLANCETIKVSSYGVRPAKVFAGSNVRGSILFFTNTGTPCKRLWTTRLNRIPRKAKLEEVLATLQWTDSLRYRLEGRFAKISLPIEGRILKKLFSCKTNIGTLRKEKGHPIYYRISGGGYYNVITNKPLDSTKEKPVYFDKKFTDTVGAFLSSTLFWWYQQIYSNNLDLKSYEIESFPIPVDRLTPDVIAKIESVYKRYLRDIHKHVREHTTEAYKHVKSFKEFKIRYSKPLIDEIDDIICPLYGLTESETEFIKNYELQFRIDR